MPDDDYEYRNRMHLTLGSKITTLFALICAATGVYYLFAPSYFRAQNGNIPCGSAVTGAPSTFAKNICNGAQHGDLALAILFLALAAIIGGAGAWMFGVTRSVEKRKVADD